MSFDVLLHGAHVVDGTGSDPQLRDVGITGDIISYLGPPLSMDFALTDGLAASATDLSGLVLAPGFIDIHTHSDVSLLHHPSGESKALQGVTTEVIGNCGFSAFPVSAQGRAALVDHLARLGDDPCDLQWKDLDGYAQVMQSCAPLLNVAALVGHGALRIAAMTDAFSASDQSDQQRMVKLLETHLAQGAFGMSTGLTHTPSSIGTSAEIERLARVCARHDALYATHARAGYGQEFAAIDEAFQVSQVSGARLEYSHLALNDPANWGRASDALARFDAARREGLEVSFDVYPYDASASTLIQYLPEWTQVGGGPGIARGNQERKWRERALADIRHGWFGGIPWHWDRITLTAAGPHSHEVGLTIQQISRQWDLPPEEVLLNLCAELGSAAQGVLHYRTENDMVEFLQHPLSIIGSDGIAVPLTPGPDQPHPRGFGTFPRVLGRYVRERQNLSLASAVHKMTEAPANQLGIQRRGGVHQGYFADLVAFDASAVIDRATFTEPRQAPDGIVHSFVNGQAVVTDGALTGRRPGTFLRHG